MQRLLEGQSARLAVDQRQQVDAEGGLHGRALVELAQHDLRLGVLGELDDDAHALAVGLVTQVGEAFQMAVACQLGDALDQAGFVDRCRAAR